MDAHEAVEFVEGSERFRGFLGEDGSYYLVHCFCTVEGERSPWQVGYYSRRTRKIVVFTAGKEVVQAPADEAFRESGHVPPLDVGGVSVRLDDALGVAGEVRRERYPHEAVGKTIVLLQVIGGRPLWNLTFITQSFNMLNIRVDAASGEVVADSLHSLMSLGRQE
ncbi:hypothetical protein JXA12_00020 [Candidatus Woesearchaeota archaeon]|nr:hypothetical protein [Candidatus Woesearchaeota archaeon]